MKLYTPHFYNIFHCLASACPDSCCKEWEVDIDANTAAVYYNLPGPLGEQLRQVLRTTSEGGTCMTIQDGRCPMWRQDGLCEIQSQLGHDALSRVCREYPRLRHDYGDFVELGLELSCPEAARLILTSNYEMNITTLPNCDIPTYDEDLMAILLRSRQEALIFLETSALPLPHRLAILLLYAYDVQAEIDGGSHALLTPEQNLADARKVAKAGDYSLISNFFLNLEILTPLWKARLKAPICCGQWSNPLLAFARYGIYRYWLQAVSDFDLVSRAKWIIISCLLINALGGDTISTAQLFSKEIENDPDNMDAILDAAYTSPAFTDAHLLGLLLAP